MSKTPDSQFTSTHKRYLDIDKINSSLENATELGAQYAEVRLVALTDSSISMRDGNLEKAIPGQEIGATLRVLADGSWGVHSTTDISSIPSQIESTVKLAKAVAARRSKMMHQLTWQKSQ